MRKKEELRSFFLNFRENIKKEEIDKASDEIRKKLLGLEEVNRARRIMVYFSYRNEVQTHELIEELLDRGKEVYIPYCIVKKREIQISRIQDLEEDLVSGAYGIKEPRVKEDSPVDILDLVLVPGVVFSRNCYRIGYGGGYYDRFMAKLPETTRTIGLTVNSLLVKSVPVGEYDLPVDMIVTEREILNS